jgi:hypothetical protein
VDNNGELRLGAGQALRFNGNSNVAGIVELLGSSELGPSEIEFVGATTIDAFTGLITGRNAVMRFTGGTGGLYNYGSLLLNSGVNDIFGDVNNAEDAKIMVAGGAAATFYDDVFQDGTLQVIKVGSTTSTAVFAGNFQGSGGSSGGGDIFFLGDLRPGNSPATVSYDNNVAFGSAASLQVELGGTAAGSQYDQVHVAGELSLDGTLDVSLINGFVPDEGNSFDILDWGTLDDEFSAINLPTLAGWTWDTSQLYTTGVLSVAAVGLTGDYNGDGTVDAADYVVWRKNPANYGGDPAGYDTWRAHFGQATGSGSLSEAAVPEPSTHVFAIFVLGAVFWRRTSMRDLWSQT